MMLSMRIAVLIVAASEAGAGWIGVVPTAVGIVTVDKDRLLGSDRG
jgi:hypothetical protein